MNEKMNDDKPIFILCVGTQKAGTSWLRKQLNKHSRINMGFIKEYNVLENIIPTSKPFPAPRDENWPNWTKRMTNVQHEVRNRMLHNDEIYENYFASLINDDIKYTGDFTVRSVSFDKNAYNVVKNKLEKVGFSVKVIFLMRDPVERNWSSLRMYAGKPFHNKLDRLIPFPGAMVPLLEDECIEDHFKSFYSNAYANIYTAYNNIIPTLRESFNREDLYIGFYETLFTDDSFDNISKFLGIDFGYADKNEKIFVSPVVPLSDASANECKQYYSNVYNYCAAEFPITNQLWS
jgi:hypothetical protein